MQAPLSQRPAFIVFDHVEAMTNARTGEVIKPAFWKATALVYDRDMAEAWANSRSRILETGHTHAASIKDAGVRYTDDDMANFFSAELLAAE